MEFRENVDGRSQGRKPIFFFSFLMGMKGLLCNLISSTVFFIHFDPNAYLLYASGLLSGT